MTLSSEIEPLVIYFAMPVGAPTPEGIALNIARAEATLGLLTLACPDVAWCAPWLATLRVLREDGPGGPNRARGMRDNLAIVRRCDALAMFGDVLGGSPGMRAEADASSEVLDCTGLDIGAAAEVINALASAVRP